MNGGEFEQIVQPLILAITPPNNFDTHLIHRWEKALRFREKEKKRKICNAIVKRVSHENRVNCERCLERSSNF